MIVQPPQLAALDWAAAAAGTLAKPWKAGSVVSGRVLEYASAARLVLQINGLKVEADPPSNGSVPRQFQARVLSEGPQPVLELLAEASRGSPTAAALRARLPRQGGLQPLLADLQALARMPGTRALPEPVRLALARLEGSIVGRHDMLDADVLRDTLQRGGLQLEHKLLEHARAPDRMPSAQVDYDFKAALQRLVQALQQLPRKAEPPVPMQPARAPASTAATAYAAASGPPAASSGTDTPPPLLRLPLQPQGRTAAAPTMDPTVLAAGMLKHVQAALARIEIMQLESHPAVSPQACMIEVPVRDGDDFDVLQVRIEQDAENAQATGDGPWTLGFTLEPPALGAIHGQLRLHGAHVHVDLWAARAASVEALEEQTSVLSQLLEASGLQLVQLRVRQGTPVRHTGLGRNLLEARA